MNVTVCQSCGMPLASAEQFGTEMDGSPTREYCIYCYKDGKFEQEDMPLEGMVEMCTTILKQEGMDEESARSMLRNQLPYLKRWQKTGNLPSTAEGSVTHGYSANLGNPALTEEAALSIAQPVRYVTLPRKRLAGLSARTTNAIEMSGEGSIGALWARYFASEHIPAPEAARYGCYSDYTDGIAGKYTILVGHEIGAEDSLPEGFDEVLLPPATYAVFTSRTGPMVEVVSEVWGAVWAWEHQSDRTFTGDFELYDERSLDPGNMQVDVYIAVKERR
ncbi:putative transcriptional regulator YdeE [Paenibacillus sp. JGP012]|uniref:zinc ribbon domain-containing protein n=1 Tax=Paenibacillus sp. JGP012 TaxID=2735914 RepID=UPI00160BA650|nr:zinc ribbon domain-containing protein [Paenibacillus sp. JGP012]MBB6023647.1 putative transcriptional regulator YdeE [Paenibacillus sp. JGP012]